MKQTASFTQTVWVCELSRFAPFAKDEGRANMLRTKEGSVVEILTQDPHGSWVTLRRERDGWVLDYPLSDLEDVRSYADARLQEEVTATLYEACNDALDFVLSIINENAEPDLILTADVRNTLRAAIDKATG